VLVEITHNEIQAVTPTSEDTQAREVMFRALLETLLRGTNTKTDDMRVVVGDVATESKDGEQGDRHWSLVKLYMQLLRTTRT